MPGAPRFVLGFLAISLLVIFLPIRLQATPQPAHPQEKSPSAYPDNDEGLRQFIQDLLVAIKSGDRGRLATLIKDTELPNYETWFTTTFGEESGKNWADSYGANLVGNEKSLQELLLQMAQQEGEVFTRKLNGAPQTANGFERGLVDALRQPVNIYFAAWDKREGAPRLRTMRIGYFLFIEGKFRWYSNARLVSAQRLRSPGDAGYPSDVPKQPVNPPVPAPDSGADEVTYEAGKNGIGRPSCLHCPPPEFPEAALRAKAGGNVTLRVIIDEDGRAADIQISKSGGPDLDKQAVEAVRKWRFKPALDKKGNPVRVFTVIEITFRRVN